ncbi:unnamed protein product [Phaedon cochleariae]|uniref:SCAN domain-containing protein n=1 Tax=Phaedon cochleariae TaxID=80249 RepID=A0A9P0DGF0_PHACE|nr:unnamed protein product [Phaedon cochleariae]
MILLSLAFLVVLLPWASSSFNSFDEGSAPNELDRPTNCNCGGKLRASIDNSGPEVEVTCNISKGDSKCGKRWLRGKTRHKIARAIEEKSAHIYRAQRANKEMCPGDAEPPNLYSSPVLRKAKSEYISSQYLDKDPVKSIFLSKQTTGANIIQNIGLDPFYVHYWTSHQTSIYKKYCSKFTSCLYIDATGGVVRKIKKADGSKTGNIFLYHSIIRLPSGQFSVCQMLSEVHNTNAINYWLTEWTRSGAPIPKEVVTDASRALLSATIRAFTNCKSIGEYADSLWHKPSACYIRIDVAHFIKIYASLVKDLPRRVRVFYLGSIGQLILSKSLKEAEKILGSILLVSQCETEGYLPSGEPCKSEAAKYFLKEIITSSEEIDQAADSEFISENLPQDEDFTVNDGNSNIWCQWGEVIDKRVQTARAEIGDRENAHFFPALSKKLMNDLYYFPMWSCVVQNQFGYGRIPASSASVEGEFNKIKTHLLSGVTGSLRADVFVNRHVDYLSGRMKIIQSKMDNDDNAIEELSREHSSVTESVTNIYCTSATHASDAISVDREEIAVEASNSLCPACQNEDKPSGAHKCVVCLKQIHALDSCSIPYKGSGEGYGQKRICLECNNVGGTSVILASREEENWRGLAKSSNPRRAAKYLQKNNYNLNEQLTSDANRKLLVIKNGSNLALSPIVLGGRNVYVMKLTDIPVYFKNPLNDKEQYQLVGLVNYTPPPPKRRSSENQGIGHSTAYCLRGGYQWVEYDDLKKNERNKKSNVYVQPVLLVFVRNKI